MFLDRVEHYFRLKSISLDRAAFLAVGLIPEVYEGFGVPWFDVLFISNANGYSRGDDADEVWQWMADCKERWVSGGGPSDGLNLREFIDWVCAEYEQPHWLPSLVASGDWERWTSDRHHATPEARRALAERLLEKHNGNQSAAAREMGVSRTRINQLLARPEKAQPLALKASDPFSLVAKSLNRKARNTKR